ncbi:hypothetical protein KIF59_00015 [Enterobacter cloacae subsp. cloacae]|nr:hypothetical protein [Enterobacter cloacae subsp. cloacae]
MKLSAGTSHGNPMNDGLGSSALKNLQSTTEDKTTGAVLRVGSFGLGAEAPTIPANDANQIVGYNGFVSGAGAHWNELE